MLNARGVSRAGAKARVLHPKQVTTLKDHVLSHKFLQCLVLHCVFLGKSAFSGLALNTENRGSVVHWLDGCEDK
jgi:hypothetical protein